MTKTFYFKDGFCSPSAYLTYLVAGESDLEASAKQVDVFNLFNSRHNMPIEAPAVFPEYVHNMFDFGALEKTAVSSLKTCETKTAVVYVTGLTMAVIATVNACKALGLELVLMHYDKESGVYFPQFVY